MSFCDISGNNTFPLQFHRVDSVGGGDWPCSCRETQGTFLQSLRVPEIRVEARTPPSQRSLTTSKLFRTPPEYYIKPLGGSSNYLTS